MLHVSSVLPPALNAGPTDNPDLTKCWHCHTSVNGTVTSYANGLYHASLQNFRTTPGAPITPLPQPSQCTDCHAQTRPTGIVQPPASELQSMDHDARFATGSISSVSQMECASCHRSPGVTWADGRFHASIGRAVPQDCTTCHYPVMVDVANVDPTSGVTYAMFHQSAQVTFQNCQSCHGTALANSTATPLAITLWYPGAFHSSVAPQPSACNDCHDGFSNPTASTQSSVSHVLAGGGATSSNQRQWMNHASASVVGKDCAVCHAADAAPGVTAWSNSDSFHAAVANVQSCAECHGVWNGGGSIAGTNNNLPAGVTDSTTVSSAASDPPSTGIPEGTLDEITHDDVNVTMHECNFCHAQAGASTVAGIQGSEWAQASFHVSFSAANPLVFNGTTGRCSNCHLNVRPPSGFTVQDHGSFTSDPGTQDCSSCHSWPGTGSASAPNWLGATGVPQFIPVGGFTVPAQPAASPVIQGGIAVLPHPAIDAVTCASCHASDSSRRPATGYDHASALIETNCNACHEAGSDLVGAPWNGATSEALGAGDTRPFTLPSVYAAYNGGSHTVTWPNHFYNSGTKIVDCKECHVIPAGFGTTTTGPAYLNIGSAGRRSTGAWAFPHAQSQMTNPDTCRMCHGNNIPR